MNGGENSYNTESEVLGDSQHPLKKSTINSEEEVIEMAKKGETPIQFNEL